MLAERIAWHNATRLLPVTHYGVLLCGDPVVTPCRGGILVVFCMGGYATTWEWLGAPTLLLIRAPEMRLPTRLRLTSA